MSSYISDKEQTNGRTDHVQHVETWDILPTAGYPRTNLTNEQDVSCW